MKMPMVDLEACKLDATELAIMRHVLRLTKGSVIGPLKSSKPKIEYNLTIRPGYRYPTDPSGSAAYVWRMLCFYCVAQHPHCCMPVMADFDIPNDYDEESARAKYADWNDWHKSPEYADCDRLRKEKRVRLDALVDKVLSTIPKDQWGGIIRWGRALGSI